MLNINTGFLAVDNMVHINRFLQTLKSTKSLYQATSKALHFNSSPKYAIKGLFYNTYQKKT